MKRKILILISIVFCFIALIKNDTAYASPIRFIKNQIINIGFGTIYFTSTASGNISMGTNSSISYGSGYSGSGSGTAGAAPISGGKTGDFVDITCSSTAILSDGTNTMSITFAEIAMDLGVAFGSGTTCAGIGNSPLTHQMSATLSDNIIYMGAQIDGSTAPTEAGAYNTTNSGGTPFIIQIVLQ